MKCPYCGHIHPEGLNTCPKTGQALKRACKNTTCSYYGEYIWSLETKICPCCGKPLPIVPITSKSSLLSCSGKKQINPEVRKTISQIIQALQVKFTVPNTENEERSNKNSIKPYEIIINEQNLAYAIRQIIDYLDASKKK